MKFFKYIGSLISSWYYRRRLVKMVRKGLYTMDLKSEPATPDAYLFQKPKENDVVL